MATHSPLADEALPPGFVRLADIAPAIPQDIRYAGPFNFTGGPVPGYLGATCILTETAAKALARVDMRLRAKGYGLKVFDCYRPRRAVASFVAFVRGDGPQGNAAVFYPDLPKAALIKEGYIASRSSHSRGSTVDVGLIVAGRSGSMTRTGGRCDGEFEQRARESSLDLGTAFDCFSTKSATSSRTVGAEALKNRTILTRAMRSEGFRGYSREWWHFTLSPEPFPTGGFDFPIR